MLIKKRIKEKPLNLQVGIYDRLPYIFGLGVILFAFHNPHLTPTINGISYLFLPQIATLLIIAVLVLHWIKEGYKLEFNRITIPLLLIVLSSFIYLLFNPSNDSLANCFLFLIMFCCYLYSKKYGEQTLNTFFYPVIIVSISVIIYAFTDRFGERTGGLLSPTNYDILAGFLVFGTLCYTGKHKWILVLFSLLAIYFSGSAEALIALCLLVPVMIYKKDFSKKIFIILAIVVPIILLNTFLGSKNDMWYGTYRDIIDNPFTAKDGSINMNYNDYVDEVKNKQYSDKYDVNGSWIYRKQSFEEAFQRISILGNGFQVFPDTPCPTSPKIVHNVPLVILDQIGIIAFLSWIWITLYCLIKTKWRYAWIGFLSVCIFDHYMFTSLCFYWWILVAVSLTNPNINDYLFKEVKNENI